MTRQVRPVRENIRAVFAAVRTEVNDRLGETKLDALKTPVFLRRDGGDCWRLSGVWFPAGKNRGFGVDDYFAYSVVRAWAHDGPIGSIELVCRDDPDETLIRWAAQAVGLLPKEKS